MIWDLRNVVLANVLSGRHLQEVLQRAQEDSLSVFKMAVVLETYNVGEISLTNLAETLAAPPRTIKIALRELEDLYVVQRAEERSDVFELTKAGQILAGNLIRSWESLAEERLLGDQATEFSGAGSKFVKGIVSLTSIPS